MCELINRNRLRVISVDIPECLPQVPETLIDLLADEAEKLQEPLLFLRFMLPHLVFLVLVGQVPLRVRCHYVCHLLRIILVVDITDLDRRKVEAIDEFGELLD